MTAGGTYEGGCLCGSVRYVARGLPVNERVCHCRLCQKALGAAFNARLLFRLDCVEIDGPVTAFNSSPDLERRFCPRCGTTLFSVRLSAGVIGVTAGSLDNPAQFNPAAHVFTASRQLWLRLEDNLAQHVAAAPT